MSEPTHVYIVFDKEGVPWEVTSDLKLAVFRKQEIELLNKQFRPYTVHIYGHHVQLSDIVLYGATNE